MLLLFLFLGLLMTVKYVGKRKENPTDDGGASVGVWKYLATEWFGKKIGRK